MNLILLEPGEITESDEVRLTGARADHVRHVLKAAPGSRVRIGVIDGAHGVGIVQSVGDREIILRGELDATIPPRPRVDLLLALPRPKVMRRLWAQIAALGVGQIVLTNAERVERNYFDTHVLTPDCYRPLLIEGLQQARDTRLPIVSIHRQFKILVEDDLDGLFASGVRTIADPAATASPRDVLPADGNPPVLLAVGPEGGWNAFEQQLLAAHGFHAIGMGVRTLRTDTACLALLALVHDAVNDSRAS